MNTNKTVKETKAEEKQNTKPKQIDKLTESLNLS